MKHTEQFKLSVVQQYLDGPDGFDKLAQRHGVAAPLLRSWVERFRLHGQEGLSKRAWGRYSVEFKLSVLQHMWENGLSYRQTAAVFNLPSATRVSDWERRHNSGAEGLTLHIRGPRKMKAPPVTPPPSPDDSKRSQEELLKELEYLRAENAYLKKLKALVESERSAPAKKRK
jgi:transposase